MIKIEADGYIEDNPLCCAKTYGNIWVMEVNLQDGDKKYGHKHEFDHLHFLAKGKVKINIYGSEARTAVERSEVVEAPAWLKVPKERFHDIEALTDSTGYCMQALRNVDGEVLETDYEDDLFLELNKGLA